MLPEKETVNIESYWENAVINKDKWTPLELGIYYLESIKYGCFLGEDENGNCRDPLLEYGKLLGKNRQFANRIINGAKVALFVDKVNLLHSKTKELYEISYCPKYCWESLTLLVLVGISLNDLIFYTNAIKSLAIPDYFEPWLDAKKIIHLFLTEDDHIISKINDIIIVAKEKYLQLPREIKLHIIDRNYPDVIYWNPQKIFLTKLSKIPLKKLTPAKVSQTFYELTSQINRLEQKYQEWKDTNKEGLTEIERAKNGLLRSLQVQSKDITINTGFTVSALLEELKNDPPIADIENIITYYCRIQPPFNDEDKDVKNVAFMYCLLSAESKIARYNPSQHLKFIDRVFDAWGKHYNLDSYKIINKYPQQFAYWKKELTPSLVKNGNPVFSYVLTH